MDQAARYRQFQYITAKLRGQAPLERCLPQFADSILGCQFRNPTEIPCSISELICYNGCACKSCLDAHCIQNTAVCGMKRCADKAWLAYEPPFWTRFRSG